MAAVVEELPLDAGLILEGGSSLLGTTFIGRLESVH